MLSCRSIVRIVVARRVADTEALSVPGDLVAAHGAAVVGRALSEELAAGLVVQRRAEHRRARRAPRACIVPSGRVWER